jgi:hypothetical protein
MTVDGVFDWIFDLVTTYTSKSYVQAITALISSLYKSLAETLSFYRLLCLHQPFPGNGFYSGDILASALKSSLHSLPYRNGLVALVVILFITIRADSTVYSGICIGCRENVFIEPFPNSDRLFLFSKNPLANNGCRSVVCFSAVA